MQLNVLQWKRGRYARFGVAAFLSVVVVATLATVFGVTPSLRRAGADASERRDAWADSISDETQAAILAGPTDVPIMNFGAGGYDLQLRHIEQGQLFVHQRGPAQPLGAIDWTHRGQGAYYGTQLHAMVGVSALLEAETRLPDEVEAAVANLILNWIERGAQPGVSERGWYEGTVVKRQATLLQGLRYVRRHGGLGTLDLPTLVRLIETHADFLLDTKNVYTFGNHGIRQDLILATTAMMVPQLPRAESMLVLAEHRLERAADALFTREGVWVEHAPGYVNYALRLLMDLDSLARSSPDFRPNRILRNVDSSADYLVRSLTPDGRIPWIGISGASDLAPIVETYLEQNGGTIAERLQRLHDSLSYFPDYGHAIIRGEHPNGLYMIFHAGQNLPAGKRHEDALSFILMNRGRLWITEAGHTSSDVLGMSRYLKSPKAHNTYTFGDMYLQPDDAPKRDAYLGAASRVGQRVQVDGFSERFLGGASVARRVDVDLAGLSVVLVDDLNAPRGAAKPWFGHLHFPGDLRVTAHPESGRVVAFDPATGEEMAVQLRGLPVADMRLFNGSLDPIYGWGRTSDRFGPLTTLRYTTEGSGRLTIEISWTDRGTADAVVAD